MVDAEKKGVNDEKNLPEEIKSSIEKEILQGAGQEIYIEELPYWTRIAIYENGRIKDILIDIPEIKSDVAVGNIYKGIIADVIPSLQAVFINVGTGKNVYLFVPSQAQMAKYKIGQEIVIQVKKESIDGKGAKVSDNPTLPGKYVVLTFEKKNGVSKKIKSKFERTRLKRIIQKLSGEIKGEFGIVARTEAENVPDELIVEDFQRVYNIMKDIKDKIEKVPAPTLLWADTDILKKAIRDYSSSNLRKIVSNSKETISRAKELVKEFLPKSEVDFIHDRDIFIFQKYGLENEFSNILKEEIEIEGGIKIIFNETEAFTAVDINTASFTGTENLDVTAYQANLMAVKEIMRQIELRKIGGIILIDMIDIKSKQLKNKMIAEIKRLAEKSKEKTKVFGLTKLGLLEISRKKTGYSIRKLLMNKCPTCGEGFVNSDILNLHQIMLKAYSSRAKTMRVSPEIYKKVDEIVKKLNLDITVQPKYGLSKWEVEM